MGPRNLIGASMVSKELGSGAVGESGFFTPLQRKHSVYDHGLGQRAGLHTLYNIACVEAQSEECRINANDRR